MAGSLTLLPSCAISPPTQEDIERTYDNDLERLKEEYQRRYAECNGDAGCIQKLNQWWNAMWTEWWHARRAARDRNWEDAYKRREEWGKKLREALPGWPAIRDLIPKAGVLSTIDVDSSSLGSQPPGTEPRSWASTITLSGTGQVSGPIILSLEVSGFLTMSGVTGVDGSRSASIYSGSVLLKAADGDGIVSMTIDKDDRNRLEIGADGTGTMTLVVTRAISDKEWNTLVPYYIQMTIPVTRSADDRVHIDLTEAKASEAIGRKPFAITDYNADGVRDHTLDYSALLGDYAQQAERADMNMDGEWTQADLDMWENLYLADQGAM